MRQLINNANNRINNNLKILSNWFNNKLQLNIKKTKIIYFYNDKSHFKTNNSITINNHKYQLIYHIYIYLFTIFIVSNFKF